MKKTSISIEIDKIIKSAKLAGISTCSLALQAGVGVETLRRWRKGENTPLYGNFKKLEEAFIYLTNKK